MRDKIHRPLKISPILKPYTPKHQPHTKAMDYKTSLDSNIKQSHH